MLASQTLGTNMTELPPQARVSVTRPSPACLEPSTSFPLLPPAQKQMSQSRLLSPNTQDLASAPNPIPSPRTLFPASNTQAFFAVLEPPNQSHQPKNLVSISKYRKHRTNFLGLMTLVLEAQGHMSCFEAQSPWRALLSWSEMSWGFAALKQLPWAHVCKTGF